MNGTTTPTRSESLRTWNFASSSKCGLRRGYQCNVPTPRKSRNAWHIPASVAPNPTTKLKLGGEPVTVKQPSPAVKPARAAGSIAGRTVVVRSTESATAYRSFAPRDRARRRTFAVATRMFLAVGDEGVPPLLELMTLVTIRQELFRERDRRSLMRSVRCDRETALREPVGVPRGGVADRAVAEEVAQGLEQRAIPLGHVHREHESASRTAVGESARQIRGEAALRGNKPAESASDVLPEIPWKKVDQAGLEPATPCMPCRCATGLRHWPNALEASSGLSCLGPLTDHAHVAEGTERH